MTDGELLERATEAWTAWHENGPDAEQQRARFVADMDALGRRQIVRAMVKAAAEQGAHPFWD